MMVAMAATEVTAATVVTAAMVVMAAMVVPAPRLKVVRVDLEVAAVMVD